MVDHQKQKGKLVWQCLLIKRSDAIFYRAKNKKIWLRIWIFIIYKKIQKQLLDKGLDISQRVVHKAGEFLGNKIADAVTESKDVNAEIQKPV